MADRGRGRGDPQRGRGRGGGGSDRGGRGGSARGDRGSGDRGSGYRGDRGSGDRGSGYRGDRGGGGGGSGDRGARGSFRGGDGSQRGGGPQDRGGPRGRGRGQRGGGAASDGRVFSYGGEVPPYSSKAEELEKALVKNKSKPSDDIDLSELSLEDRLPRRPAYGESGKRVVLWANYFELNTSMEMTLHRYSVNLKPEVTGKKLEQVIRLLLSEQKNFMDYEKDIASDFRSTLVARVQLPQECMGEFQVVYRAEHEDEPGPRATTYKVTVSDPRQTLQMADLISYVTSTDAKAAYSDRLLMIQSLNVIVADYARRSPDMVTVGQNRVFSLDSRSPRHDLTRGLQALRGFFSSVRLATSRLLINVNVAHGAFFPPIPLSQLIDESGLRGPHRIIPFIKGVKVKSTHLKPRMRQGKEIPRVKTVSALAHPGDGAGHDHPPRVTKIGAGPREVQFWLNEGGPQAPPAAGDSAPKSGKKKKGKAAEPTGPTGGKYITVFDFFKETHNIRIQRDNLPVVNVGTRENPSYLPAEVCIVMPGQAYSRKLSPNQTAAMIAFAVRKGWENAESITTDGAKAVGLKAPNNDKIETFQMSISSQLITVPGRVLDGPKIRYLKGKGFTDMSPHHGTWNMADVKFNDARPMAKWGYVRFKWENTPHGTGFEVLPRQMKRFQEALRKVGMQAENPVYLGDVFIQSSTDAVVGQVIKTAADQNLALLYVILPDKDSQLYNHIKQLADITYGVHTTCTAEVTLKKQLDRTTGEGLPKEIQLLTNLALKVNLKLGGTNQIVDTTRLPIISNDKTMFVGIDVTHPSPGSAEGTPSVAAVVANVDKLMGQWPAALLLQRQARGEMVIQTLQGMIASRLELWKTKGKHASYPRNIMVYRDGVSEGQYELVLEHELPQIRAACRAVYPAPDTKAGLPRITIVVVGKRHHTRFYPTSLKDIDRSHNCEAGTVVDRGVTEARRWDFFLQAHAALQGTARPAHYEVVCDEIFTGPNADPAQQGGNTQDLLEKLTLVMSGVFGRATKVISYATPARYADMVCERARIYLSSFFDPDTPPETSAGGSTSGPGGLQPDNSNVTLHPRLKDSMFYV